MSRNFINFKNTISGIQIEDKVFKYIKQELLSDYSFYLLNNMLSLPCMRYESEHKFCLLKSLIEDGETDEKVIEMLCSALTVIDTNAWSNFIDSFKDIIFLKYHLLGRSSQLRLAHTMEILYAKGFPSCEIILKKLYNSIKIDDCEYNPYSTDNVRVRLARAAYSCNRFNYTDFLADIQYIKLCLKASKNKRHLGAAHYYMGICLFQANIKHDNKDASHYLKKAKEKCFDLADIFINYRAVTNRSETSSFFLNSSYGN